MKYLSLACVFSFFAGVALCNLLYGIAMGVGIFGVCFDLYCFGATLGVSVCFWIRAQGRRDETRMEVEQE